MLIIPIELSNHFEQVKKNYLINKFEGTYLFTILSTHILECSTLIHLLNSLMLLSEVLKHFIKVSHIFNWVYASVIFGNIVNGSVPFTAFSVIWI